MKAFSLEERENKLYYKDIPFNEDYILLVYDEVTKNEIEKQIAAYICDFDKYNKV
ncbi:hypothetical protein H8K01_13700 [Clostridium perfringens]|nr:hypothetical protein [Clostridium perfringens]MBI6033667.1 hypothetical protein [Clostridium perfringens]